MTCFSINVMLNYLWTNNMSDNRLLKYNKHIFVYFGRESVVLSFWGDQFILEFSKSLISIHSE